MDAGTKVKFVGASDEQVGWGSNDDPREYLQLGGIYTIKEKDVHSWHTKVTLEEFPDYRFNSVHFEELDHSEATNAEVGS